MKYDPSLSHFDLDYGRGVQGELFVDNIRDLLGDKSARVEVKADHWFVHKRRYYIEHECCGRDGVWRPSGIATTKSPVWCITWGKHPAMVSYATEWVRRACKHAVARDARNGEARCTYGENPTRGIYLYENDLVATRDRSLDEHED